MPGVFDDISHFTPLGVAVEALQDSMLGQSPPVSGLAPRLVMAANALGFGYLARRFFR